MKVLNWLLNLITLVLVLAMALLLVSINGERVTLDMWFFRAEVTLGAALVLFFIAGTFLGFCINLLKKASS